MIRLELINEAALDAPGADEFQQWLNQIAQSEKVTGEVCIKVVDAAESQYLNATYRNKQKPTNVLSFPSEVPDFVDTDHLGDLAICAEVVAQEADDQHKPQLHHWAHMTIHGVLHLLGYDHIETDDAVLMEALEVKLLHKLGIANPYEVVVKS